MHQRLTVTLVILCTLVIEKWMNDLQYGMCISECVPLHELQSVHAKMLIVFIATQIVPPLTTKKTSPIYS